MRLACPGDALAPVIANAPAARGTG